MEIPPFIDIFTQELKKTVLAQLGSLEGNINIMAYNILGNHNLSLAKQLDIPYASPPAVLTGSDYLCDYLT